MTRALAGSDVRLAAFSTLTSPEVYGILQLRSEVFVVEQDCPYLDLDGLDTLSGTVHAFIPKSVLGLPAVSPRKDSHGGDTGQDLTPIACARLLPAEIADGPAARPGARSIGRVVSSPSARGTGAGKAIFEALIAAYGAQSELTLNAQAYAKGFYEKFGFSVSGPEFIEDDIPHVPMVRPQG